MPNPTIRVLDDFQRYGLIGQWFGELQLIDVGYPKNSSRRIGDLICNVACANGHRGVRSWPKLQRSPACSLCNLSTRRAHIYTANMTGRQLLAAITGLPAARRRLFDALINSRRRLPGQDRVAFRDRDLITTDRELIKDAYNHALAVADPVAELEEMRVNFTPFPSASSSLAEGMFLYTEVV